MPFLSLDTCVWLGLIKIDLYDEAGAFDEVCFLIEKKHIIHIVPENILREWNRNKVKKALEINKSVKDVEKTAIKALQGNKELVSAYQPSVIDSIIEARIQRVSEILEKHSELAKESDSIYIEAGKRNLDCVAPNDPEDSFRDTVNILTIINYIEEKNYTDCYFSTINYKDFSVSKIKKHYLHSGLTEKFDSVNLSYVYCDEDPFGERLIHLLRSKSTKFQEFLKEKKRKAEEAALLERKSASEAKIASTDKEYLENLKHLDLILSKETVTVAEEQILKMLFDTHQSYKDYFFNRIGS